MKPQSPLATMDKPSQRQKLNRDSSRYLRNGGQVEQLDSGTARGLSPVGLSDIHQKLGLYREL